jgi:hypothetical protein
MRPRMGADRMGLGGDLSHDVGVLSCHFPHHKEGRIRALCGQRREDRPRVAGRRTIIEGQHDLAGCKEIRIAMSLAEPRSAGRVDFGDAGDAKTALVQACSALLAGGRPSSAPATHKKATIILITISKLLRCSLDRERSYSAT